MSQAAAAAGAAITGADADYTRTIAQLEAFAAAAPSSVRGDLNVVVEGYSRVARVFAGSGYNPASGQPPSSALLRDLEQATSSLDEPAYRAAAERVEKWFEAGCRG